MSGQITYEQARARIPATADQVRDIIARLERECRSRAARIKMAEMAIKFANVTDDGREVWREYVRGQKTWLHTTMKSTRSPRNGCAT